MSEKILINGNYPMDKIAGVLDKGGIVIMPSDTVYGFLFTKEASEKVREIKRRDNKPFLFFISDMSNLDELNVIYKPFINILKKNWPGSFTFIFDSIDGTTSGVRMPKWNVLNELAAKTGKILYSTSVNFSGEPPLENPTEMEEAFGDSVDLFVFDEKYLPGIPSSIVRLSATDGIKEVRAGGGKLKL